ncbi:hypothetical protein [Amycolatopsis sp. NBC_01480]|uniref:hypothetical protein n=1 Tax=Amycolatopsis sp. NBC_01480 TaxID=2903562 RepID=UPI002E2873BC|nr:hypothetical protein [Amycolatopsis sp. NBC_01480]
MASVNISEASPLLQAQARLATHVTEAAGIHPPRPEWRHNSVEALLLSHGRWFRPAPMPSDRPLGVEGLCFANAAQHAARFGLAYVEGYALASGVVGLPHAWCAHPDGTVEDPTWNTDGHAYLGIPFTELYLREQEQRGNINQLLFEQHLNGWDLLRDGVDGAIAANVGRPYTTASNG